MEPTLSRRTVLGAPAAGVFAGAQAAARPNVLVILTDQQSVSALSANGNRYLHTPAMDRLASGGVSLLESYCAYPLCSPSRGSLFTGRMPHETGVRNNNRAIAPGIPTLGEHFRERGYKTVYAGKWHVPASFKDPVGFEQIYGGNALGANMDEPTAAACIRFLQAKPQQPFLLVASFMNPHDVCSWIRAHPGSRSYPSTARFPPVRLNMAVDPEEPEYIQYHRSDSQNLMGQAVTIASEWSADDFRFYLHDYYRLVEDVDRQIGRLLAVLEATGLHHNTLVVLTSDHGEGLGAHRWVQKGGFWEEVVKVPLIVAGKGVGRKGVIEEHTLASGLDIVPTICDYAGIGPPRSQRGLSLRPAIEGRGMARRFVVSELCEYGRKEREGRMLRSARYKYVVFNGGARPEQLFDLRLDPGETLNLARNRGAAGLLEEHRGMLRRWIGETADDFRFPEEAAR